jgi:hypothetical protein
MKRKLLLISAVFAVVGLVASGVASAAFVAIYRNAMETTTQRAEIRKMFGKSCTRGGGATSLKVTVGKTTEECAYSTPVVGQDLEIAVTGRIISGTPTKVANKAFLGLQLRTGGGKKLELRVFPAQKKVQIARITEEGIKFLAIKKNVKSVQEPSKPNVLRLRVVEAAGEEKGTCKIGGYLGGELAVEASDLACSELEGEGTAISAGAPNNGSGLIAGFEAIVVRTPVRF